MLNSWKSIGYDVATIIVAVIAMTGPSKGQSTAPTVECQLGYSSRWGSSWCDLGHPQDISAGSTVEIHLKPGGAKKVLVRFLASQDDPNNNVGIVGGMFEVPSDGIVRLPLTKDRKDIKQISVHGGPRAWDTDLGQENGPAIIQGITVK